MPEKYTTLSESCTETVISRSRFITHVFGVSSEDDAIGKLKQLKKQYSDATHICYGYVADREGRTARFSDAGEPGGTAGQPIIEAIKKRDYRCVLVAVVRYFGGVKLGAGGLTRAYSDCATTGMNNSKELRFELCAVYSVQLDFSLHKKIVKTLSAAGIVLKTEYSDIVSLEIAAPLAADFPGLIRDLSGGRVYAQKTGESYIQNLLS